MAIDMIKNLPKEIQEALQLLWDYSDDACLSGRTQEECEEEGFDCQGESAHYVTFVISRRSQC